MFNQDNVTKDGFLDQLFRRMGVRKWVAQCVWLSEGVRERSPVKDEGCLAAVERTHEISNSGTLSIRWGHLQWKFIQQTQQIRHYIRG